MGGGMIIVQLDSLRRHQTHLKMKISGDPAVHHEHQDAFLTKGNLRLLCPYSNYAL